MPDSLSFEAAAGLPCPALTAWMTMDKLPLRKGAELLISGAGGAVGLYLTQRAIEQQFSVSVLCHARRWERLRALVAVETFSSEEPLPAFTNDRYFAALDTVGSSQVQQVSRALAANGHLVCIQDRVTQWPSPAFGRTLSLHEVALGALHQYGDDAAWTRLTQAGTHILQSVAGGRWQSEPLVIGEFADLPEQLASLRTRRFSGKPVVRVEHQVTAAHLHTRHMISFPPSECHP